MKFAYTISDTLYAYDHKANRLKADFAMKNYRKSDDIYCIYFPMQGKYVTWVKGRRRQQHHVYRKAEEIMLESDKSQIKKEQSELLAQYYDGSFSRMVCDYIHAIRKKEEVEELMGATKGI